MTLRIVRARRPGPVPAGHRWTPRSRAVVLSAVGGLTAAAVLPSASALGAAATGPVVTVVAASPTGELQRFPGDPLFFDGVGVYAVSGAANIEIRTTRPDYRTPPRSDLILRSGGTTTRTRLPDGLAGFDGLADFATMTVKDSHGTTVQTSSITWCPGGFGASRMQPDAKALSPYPDFCFGSPWALGGVTGLPAHWASPLGGGFFGGFGAQAADPVDPGDLPDGVYTVTTRMTPAWRKVLKTPRDRATAVVKVTVSTIEVPPDGGGDGGPTATATPGGTATASAPATTAPAVAGARSLTANRSGGAARSPLGAANRRFPTAIPADLIGRADGLLTADGASGAGASGNGGTVSGFAPPAAANVPAGGVSALSAGVANSGSMDNASAKGIPNRFKPDLRALPAFGFGIIGDFEDPLSTREYLSFAATVWNAGPSPLVVDGYRRPGSGIMDAHQFFYDAKGKEVGHTNTGTMLYDPRTGHQHWHFQDFAKYELVKADGTTVLSAKEAFCLAPTDAVDLTVKGAQYKPNSTGLSTACGGLQSIAIRETLDTGWGDTYGQFLPGQAFDVTDLPNGTYTVRITANPSGHLLEGSTSNNVSERTVILGGDPGARTVEVPPFEGLDIP